MYDKSKLILWRAKKLISAKVIKVVKCVVGARISHVLSM